MEVATRQVVKIGQTGQVEVQREPLPPLEPGCLRVRVYASLLSPGTELGAYVGKPRTETTDPRWRTFGYQNAGVVIAVGEGVRGYTVGQRVACMGGNYALHADYANVPQNMAVALPESVSYEEGAFIALAATAMQAARRGEIAFGEEAVLLGLGLVGQLTAQVCRIAGLRVAAFDPFPLRCERAQQTGCELASPLLGEAAIARAQEITAGRGMDVAFLCMGGEATEALKSAVQMMRQAPDTHRSGRIVIVGGAMVSHRFGADLGNLDLRSAARTGPGYHDKAYERGDDYPGVFVRWDTQAHLRLFVRWLVEGHLRVRDLITDRVPIQHAATACYALMDAPQDHLGVVITYEE